MLANAPDHAGAVDPPVHLIPKGVSVGITTPLWSPGACSGVVRGGGLHTSVWNVDSGSKLGPTVAPCDTSLDLGARA